MRMETNEKEHEMVSSNATNEVNSSIRFVSVLLAICSEVMTKRQNPNRFADVPNICGEVLLAISIILNPYLFYIDKRQPELASIFY